MGVFASPCRPPLAIGSRSRSTTLPMRSPRTRDAWFAATLLPELADYATPQALYDAWGGKTPNQVLIESYAVEGVARLDRSHAGMSCQVNYAKTSVCTDAPVRESTTCDHALFDADWHSE